MRHRIVTHLLLVGVVAVPGSRVLAQVPADGPVTLTLERAIQIAEESNPAYLSTRNDAGPAAWQVREAYASAFLPSANTNFGMAYTGAGRQSIGTLDFGRTPERYRSFYSLSLNYTMDGNTLFALPSARAARDATEARIDAAAFNLESAVTLQYMTVLRARDGVEVARRQLDFSRENLSLVETRVEAGAAAAVDARQAEVQRGRDEAALLQAERLLRAEKLRLMEQLGVSYPQGVELASEFRVFEPRWSLDELLERALARHPQLRAFRSQERSSQAQVRQARSAYFPSVRLSASLSGFTLETGDEQFLIDSELQRMESRRESCEFFNAIANGIDGSLPGYPQDCSAIQLTEPMRQEILAANDVFPFDFDDNPVNLSLTVSLPIFSGFSRQRQSEQAEATLRDARQSRRAEELRLRTAVTQALDDLESARRLVEIEARNREVAGEQLDLARQRYALGATSFIELLDAQRSTATAERDHLDAIYAFHTALAGLEAAVGTSLRDEARSGGEGR